MILRGDILLFTLSPHNAALNTDAPTPTTLIITSRFCQRARKRSRRPASPPAPCPHGTFTTHKGRAPPAPALAFKVHSARAKKPARQTSPPQRWLDRHTGGLLPQLPTFSRPHAFTSCTPRCASYLRGGIIAHVLNAPPACSMYKKKHLLIVLLCTRR